ncbi:MAG: NAD(P)-binding domain-containing protein [Gammaproteobacteria bacterium]|nr:NAD(P)-binding domain-containing protein [Gammaproteobacteria bacterium]
MERSWRRLRTVNATWIIYALPMLGIWAWYLRKRSSAEKRSLDAKKDAETAGLAEPVSLHPIIDPAICIGCESCVRACPEQPEHMVLGMINGKANLITAGDCIGHGACRSACPVGAISLVFGSEKRGVDIPTVSPDFESSVPGIFIAGELGGMGLIRNALEQGRRAVEHISERIVKNSDPSVLDLIIVGAGPAGFSASLMAMSKHMKFVTLEQDSLGGAVFQYPRGKVVMTAPAELPMVGKVKFRSTSKEELLAFWQEVERMTGVQIRYKERVENIVRTPAGFFVRTSKGELRAQHVLLAIGRRGTPRKLGVEGEGLPKVVYRLIDAEQYRGKRVLVVGGGDSALEAATSIADVPETQVTLSYRGDGFSRAKAKNRDRLQQATASGRLRQLLKSNVLRIEPDAVVMDCGGGNQERLPNDAVIVSAGGVLPTAFLETIGINVETKHGTA